MCVDQNGSIFLFNFPNVFLPLLLVPLHNPYYNARKIMETKNKKKETENEEEKEKKQ